MSKLKSFQEKYIKYKEKYVNLQKQIYSTRNHIQDGGYDCNNDVVFKNIVGTCWMVALQTIFSFGDATSGELENSVKILEYREYLTDEVVTQVSLMGFENMTGMSAEKMHET